MKNQRVFLSLLLFSSFQLGACQAGGSTRITPNTQVNPSSLPILPSQIKGTLEQRFLQVKGWKGTVRISTEFQVNEDNGDGTAVIHKESVNLSGDVILMDRARETTGLSTGNWPTLPVSTTPLFGSDLVKAMSGWHARAIIRTEETNTNTQYSKVCTCDDIYDLAVNVNLEPNKQYGFSLTNAASGGPFKLKCVESNPGQEAITTEELFGLNFDADLSKHLQDLPQSGTTLTQHKVVNAPYNFDGKRKVTLDWNLDPVN